MWGQFRRGRAVLGEPVFDDERAEERLHDALLLGLAALAKERVQFIEIGDAGHGRGEPALHGLDGALGVGLLIASCRHAEVGIEGVVTGQRGVPRVEPALSSLQDQRGDRPGIVPPHFPGDAAEELEGGDHAFEDRLDALERQRQDEGGVGIGPGGDQKGNQASAVGEVDVDVTEVGLDTLAREVSQGNEGFLVSQPMPLQVALHLAVAAVIAVLVAEPAEDLHGGVPLLGRPP